MNKLKKSKDQTSFSYKVIAAMVCISLAAICVLGISSLLSGCKAKEFPMRPFVAEPLGEFDDAEEASHELLYLGVTQPEILASAMSAFSTYFGHSEIFANSDPEYLDDRMDDGDGANVHFALSMCLADVLSRAECTLGTWSGEAKVLFMTQRVENPSEPKDYGLAWDTVTLENEQILSVAIEENGQKMFGYYLVSGGFQRMVPVLETDGLPILEKSEPASEPAESEIVTSSII